MPWTTSIVHALSETDDRVVLTDCVPTGTRWPVRVVLDAGTVNAELAFLTGENRDTCTYIIERGVLGSDAHPHDAGASISRSIPTSPLGLGDPGEHPTLGAHVNLGLAETHTHDFEPAGSVATHAATPHGGEAGPHDHDANYAAIDDTRLTDARTPTAHVHDYAEPAHAHTAADVGASATGHSHDITHDHDAEYAPTHAHPYSSDAHNHDGSYAGTGHTHDLTAYATDADLTAHAATPHGGESGEAFPVGSLFLSTVATNPATLLGYGTWSAYGDGRLLMSSDTAGQTGGSSTHTHAAHAGVINHTHPVTDPGHAHVENSNNTTTGPNRGWGAADTSTNTSMATGYSTASATTGLTIDNPSGGVSELTHDSPSHLPPYITVHVWERTA